MFSVRTIAFMSMGAFCQLSWVGEAAAQSPAAQFPAAKAPVAKAPAAKPAFTPEEQAARQKILTSDAWVEARQKFEAWQSVQVAYTPAAIEAAKASLTARIEQSTAADLEVLLHTMQRRLDVLLSPEVVAARDWADTFYTELGKQDLLKKQGLEDPLAMSATDLKAALARFGADRQSQANANAANMRIQSAAVAGANEARRRQESASAAAAAASAARPWTSSSSAYVPKRPSAQRYEAPYNPIRYSIGPWGGVWAGH